MKRLLIALTVVTLPLCLGLAAVPAQTPAKSPAARPLTLELLAGLFKQLDCDVKPIENARGEHVGYESVFRSREHKFSFAVKARLAGDGSTVWLAVPLAKVEDVEGVPAAIFLKLLSANRRSAPAFFAYADSECGLYLYLPAYALGLTAGGLEQQLEMLAQTMRDTHSLWDTKSWPDRRK